MDEDIKENERRMMMMLIDDCGCAGANFPALDRKSSSRCTSRLFYTLCLR